MVEHCSTSAAIRSAVAEATAAYAACSAADLVRRVTQAHAHRALCESPSGLPSQAAPRAAHLDGGVAVAEVGTYGCIFSSSASGCPMPPAAPNSATLRPLLASTWTALQPMRAARGRAASGAAGAIERELSARALAGHAAKATRPEWPGRTAALKRWAGVTPVHAEPMACIASIILHKRESLGVDVDEGDGDSHMCSQWLSVPASCCRFCSRAAVRQARPPIFS